MMNICQYFLKGRCRYGENCRFEHSYNTDDRNIRNNANSQQLSNVIKRIAEEVIIAEKGGQWPLSCFSPIKEGANIPGWEDISPEEVRWKMYEAQAKGNLNQCINEINLLYSNAEKRRNALKQPTMEDINLIVNVLKIKKEPPNTSNPFSSSSSTNIFGGSGHSTNPQRNLFGGATQSPGSHGSIFGGASQSITSQGNIFGSAQSTGNTGSIFSSSSPNFSNQNIFGGSTSSSSSFSQNVFQSNQNVFSNMSGVGNGTLFSSTPTSGQNIFGNVQGDAQPIFPPATKSSIFSNEASGASVFGSQGTFFQGTGNKIQMQPNVFGGGLKEDIFKSQNSQSFNSQQPVSNVFQQAQATISQQRPNAMDSSVYSKVESLTEEEIKSFIASTFTFGKIPLKPPAQEYCN